MRSDMHLQYFAAGIEKVPCALTHGKNPVSEHRHACRDTFSPASYKEFMEFWREQAAFFCKPKGETEKLFRRSGIIVGVGGTDAGKGVR